MPGPTTEAFAELTAELDERTAADRLLRRLEALLAVANHEASLIISGNGDVIEPEQGLIAIGSGGPFAQAAALGLLRHTDLDAETVAREALTVAGEICIYTNDQHTVESLEVS